MTNSRIFSKTFAPTIFVYSLESNWRNLD